MVAAAAEEAAEAAALVLVAKAFSRTCFPLRVDWTRGLSRCRRPSLIERKYHPAYFTALCQFAVDFRKLVCAKFSKCS